MKKNLIIVPILAILIVSLLVSCTKENIKKGDKKIIGTWSLTEENITEVSEAMYVITYLPTSVDYTNYTMYSKSSSISTISGTKETSVISEVLTYTPDTYSESYSKDTTEIQEYSYEITFKEDGTFKLIMSKTQEINTKSKFDNSITTISKIGTWEWVDAVEEKMGIRLTYEMYYDDEEIGNYAPILYIEK